MVCDFLPACVWGVGGREHSGNVSDSGLFLCPQYPSRGGCIAQVLTDISDFSLWEMCNRYEALVLYSNAFLMPVFSNTSWRCLLPVSQCLRILKTSCQQKIWSHTIGSSWEGMFFPKCENATPKKTFRQMMSPQVTGEVLHRPCVGAFLVSPMCLSAFRNKLEVCVISSCKICVQDKNEWNSPLKNVERINNKS